jgi:hypothetical protein
MYVATREKDAVEPMICRGKPQACAALLQQAKGPLTR